MIAHFVRLRAYVTTNVLNVAEFSITIMIFGTCNVHPELGHTIVVWHLTSFSVAGLLSI